MKDSRISVWVNPTSNATGSTTNTGPTIDLYSSGVPAGGTYQGTDVFGIGVEIIQTNTSGTAQTTVWEWEVSADASTWRKGGFIGLATLDSAGKVVRLHSTLQSFDRYARILATNSGTGESTSNIYTEDYSLPFTKSPSLA